MNLGERIKQLRIKLNLTRTQLAAELNIKYSTLSNYENNVREPDYATLKMICEFFSTSPNYLLGCEQEDNILTTEIVWILHEIRLLNGEEINFFVRLLQFFKWKKLYKK